MTEDKEPDPDGLPEEQSPLRAAPKKRDDSEKALGLEVARLFGLDPRQMMEPKKPKPDDRQHSGSDEEGSEPGRDSV